MGVTWRSDELPDKNKNITRCKKKYDSWEILSKRSGKFSSKITIVPNDFEEYYNNMSCLLSPRNV